MVNVFLRIKYGKELTNQARRISKKSSKGVSQILKEMILLNSDYDLPYSNYEKNKYFELTPEKQKEKAHKRQIYRQKIGTIMSAAGWSFKKANSRVKDAKKKFGITLNEYIENELYKSESAVKEYAEEKARAKKRKPWVKKICKIAGWEAEYADYRLKRAEELFGIEPKIFLKKRLYEMSETRMAKKQISRQQVLNKRAEIYDKIQELSGKSKKQVIEELRQINEAYPELKANLNWYFSNDMFKFDRDADNDKYNEIISSALKKKALAKSISQKLDLIDQNQLGYDSIHDEIDEYYRLTDMTMSDERRALIAERMQYSMPQIYEDGDLYKKITTDVYVTTNLLDYFPSEYITFDFYNKPIDERRNFVSCKLREDVFKVINSDKIRDMFDDKYQAYEKLKKYYGRDMIMLDGANRFDEFVEFCRKHKTFVKKNNFDSLGRGVEKVIIDNKDETGKPVQQRLRELYDSYSRENSIVILEELIIPHEIIAFLNKDSVNTVRMTVFAENGVANVQDTFMKVGRAGSFIDNGGAGGILVHIDSDTGELKGAGIDEKGLRYVTHPDHGYAFEGIRLPRWADAVEMATAATLEIGESCYIGWDITCNKDGKWIIVEGNSNTQFYGQQGPLGKGVKEQFLKNVGYSEKVADKEIADRETGDREIGETDIISDNEE